MSEASAALGSTRLVLVLDVQHILSAPPVCAVGFDNISWLSCLWSEDLHICIRTLSCLKNVSALLPGERRLPAGIPQTPCGNASIYIASKTVRFTRQPFRSPCVVHSLHRHIGPARARVFLVIFSLMIYIYIYIVYSEMCISLFYLVSRDVASCLALL